MQPKVAMFSTGITLSFASH